METIPRRVLRKLPRLIDCFRGSRSNLFEIILPFLFDFVSNFLVLGLFFINFVFNLSSVMESNRNFNSHMVRSVSLLGSSKYSLVISLNLNTIYSSIVGPVVFFNESDTQCHFTCRSWHTIQSKLVFAIFLILPRCENQILIKFLFQNHPT